MCEAGAGTNTGMATAEDGQAIESARTHIHATDKQVPIVSCSWLCVEPAHGRNNIRLVVGAGVVSDGINAVEGAILIDSLSEQRRPKAITMTLSVHEKGAVLRPPYRRLFSLLSCQLEARNYRGWTKQLTKIVSYIIALFERVNTLQV